jgi:hypothetical protein
MAQRSGAGGAGTASRGRAAGAGTVGREEVARLRADEIRDRLRRRGATGLSGMRKDDLVDRLVRLMRADGRRAAGGRAAGGRAGGGSPDGRAGSRSLRYAQRISSPQDRPERPGRSLVTSDHEVIRRWARARGAKPATIEGTERDGRPGVLTFDFPGFKRGGRLRQITWESWFDVFDSRRLNLIYQEQMRDGRQSNFFRTESPQREDG